MRCFDPDARMADAIERDAFGYLAYLADRGNGQVVGRRVGVAKKDWSELTDILIHAPESARSRGRLLHDTETDTPPPAEGR